MNISKYSGSSSVGSGGARYYTGRVSSSTNSRVGSVRVRPGRVRPTRNRHALREEAGEKPRDIELARLPEQCHTIRENVAFLRHDS